MAKNKYALVPTELPKLSASDLANILDEVVPALLENPGQAQLALAKAWPALISAASREGNRMLKSALSKKERYIAMGDMAPICTGCLTRDGTHLDGCTVQKSEEDEAELNRLLEAL